MTDLNREVGDLPLVSSILGTDVFPLSREGSSKSGSALAVASYVIALLTSGAPTALDTWLEIVARLESDEDSLASILTSLAGKADGSATAAALAKRLAVDASQSFSAGEKTQGRANLGVAIGTDVQAHSASLALLAALGTPSTGQIIRHDGTKGVWSDQVQRGNAIALSGQTGSGTIAVPTGTRRICVSLFEVSLSGTDNILVRGGAGSLETNGYTSSCGTMANGATGVDPATNGFVIRAASAASLISGEMLLTNIGGNDWVQTWVGKNSTTSVSSGGGSKTFSGALDRISLLRSGADTFDSGSVNFLFQ